MNNQIRTTLNYGSGKAGIERSKMWAQAAKEYGYRGVSSMVIEMVEWIMTKTDWVQGEGITGFRKDE